MCFIWVIFNILLSTVYGSTPLTNSLNLLWSNHIWSSSDKQFKYFTTHVLDLLAQAQTSPTTSFIPYYHYFKRNFCRREGIVIRCAMQGAMVMRASAKRCLRCEIRGGVKYIGFQLIAICIDCGQFLAAINSGQFFRNYGQLQLWVFFLIENS